MTISRESEGSLLLDLLQVVHQSVGTHHHRLDPRVYLFQNAGHLALDEDLLVLGINFGIELLGSDEVDHPGLCLFRGEEEHVSHHAEGERRVDFTVDTDDQFLGLFQHLLLSPAQQQVFLQTQSSQLLLARLEVELGEEQGGEGQERGRVGEHCLDM